MKAGWLIAFEGIDGSGKSTQVEALAGALRKAGREVVVTREPGDGPFGRRIREMARSGRRVAPEEELRWFVEDRRSHVAQVIRPGLAAGKTVLTDRYFLSSVAYQGARGIDPERILTDSEAEFPVPALAVLLEIEPALGLARARLRPGQVEPAFEERAFLERVAAIFAAIDRPYVQRIDARRDVESVRAAIADAVRRRLALL